jgi:hypothetical protein
LLIFKTFSFHNMAPVTGAVADADDYKFIFLSCSLKSFRAPGFPVHGVVRMLKEVRTCFVNQAIGHGDVELLSC